MEIYKKLIEERFKNKFCVVAEKHYGDPTQRFHHFGHIVDVTDNSVILSNEKGIAQIDFSEILDIHKVTPR